MLGITANGSNVHLNAAGLANASVTTSWTNAGGNTGTSYPIVGAFDPLFKSWVMVNIGGTSVRVAHQFVDVG